MKHMNLAQDIADNLLALGAGSVSRRADELIGESNYMDLGDIKYLDLFNDVVCLLRAQKDYRIIIFVFSISLSKKIYVNPDVEFSNYYLKDKIPTLYLLSGQDVFAEAHEEYRVRISLLTEGAQAVFRSWRDERAAIYGWEFSNDIYLWSIVESESPPPVR